MVLNKKGWHKFTSICLCIAALCITSKHSLLPLETGEGETGTEHFAERLWDKVPLHRRKPPPPLCRPQSFPRAPLSFLSPFAMLSSLQAHA